MVELTEGMQLSELLKIVCKKFGCKENYKIAKLYNKSGLPLFNDDIMLLGGGDFLYLAIKGNYFSLHPFKVRNSTLVLFSTTIK